MTIPTGCVRGTDSDKYLRFADNLAGVVAWLDDNEYAEVTTEYLRKLTLAAYEKAGKVERGW